MEPNSSTFQGNREKAIERTGLFSTARLPRADYPAVASEFTGTILLEYQYALDRAREGVSSDLTSFLDKNRKFAAHLVEKLVEATQQSQGLTNEEWPRECVIALAPHLGDKLFRVLSFLEQPNCPFESRMKILALLSRVCRANPERYLQCVPAALTLVDGPFTFFGSVLRDSALAFIKEGVNAKPEYVPNTAQQLLRIETKLRLKGKEQLGAENQIQRLSLAREEIEKRLGAVRFAQEDY